MQNAIATIKGTNPIVLTVANNVTPADVANGLNALGVAPGFTVFFCHQLG